MKKAIITIAKKEACPGGVSNLVDAKEKATMLYASIEALLVESTESDEAIAAWSTNRSLEDS